MKKMMKWTLVAVVVLAMSQVLFYWRATRSPQWEYARRALACKGANFDLRYCVDLPASSRKDFTHSSWKPLPCINTATSFYDEHHRAGNCNKFMANPGRWGFREVSADEAVPGDLMLFLRKRDGARHAGVYTMDSVLGPLCANTVVFHLYAHYLPMKPFLLLRVGGFYTTRYYRYVGR